MAIIIIADELIQLQPTVLNVLRCYFRTFEPMIAREAHTKRFAITGRGVPIDQTVVNVTMQQRVDGSLYVRAVQW
jgi:hypothetical protein